MCRPSTCPPPPTGHGGPTPNSTGCGHSAPPSPAGTKPWRVTGAGEQREPRSCPVPSRPCRHTQPQLLGKGRFANCRSWLPVRFRQLHHAPLLLAGCCHPRAGRGAWPCQGSPVPGSSPAAPPKAPPRPSYGSAAASRTAWREGSFPGSLASSAARRGRAPPWPGRALPAPRWAPRDRAASAELPPSPLAARARAETWKGAETSDFQQPLAGFPCIDSIPALPRLLTDSPQHSCAAEDAAEEPHAPQTPRGSAGIIGKLRYRVSK